MFISVKIEKEEENERYGDCISCVLQKLNYHEFRIFKTIIEECKTENHSFFVRNTYMFTYDDFYKLLAKNDPFDFLDENDKRLLNVDEMKLCFKNITYACSHVVTVGIHNNRDQTIKHPYEVK